MKMPTYIKKYFWEVDSNNLELEEDAHYIISRLLEYGTPQAIKWLLKVYSKKTIKLVAKDSYQISKRTKAFWANIEV